MQNIPLFGSSATLLSPPAGTVTSGFLPLQFLPAEYLNYYLNADTQAVQEIVGVVTFAGLTPGTSQQLLPALSGILTNAFAGTYVNKVKITQPASLATLTISSGKTLTDSNTLTLYGTDGNSIQTDSAIRSTCQGMLMAYVSTTSFSVAAGAVGDSTFVDMLYLAATTTKTTSAWAVGSGNGGLDTGAIAASTWYAVYLIKRVDTGVVDVIFSTSGTSPTLPSNYTLFRRIGWVRTNGSSQFIQWTQVGRRFYWQAKISELSTVTPANTNRILVTVTVPVNTEGLFSINVTWTSTSSVGWFDTGYTALTDSAASSSNFVFFITSVAGSAGASATGQLRVIVDASNQIYYRVSATSCTVNLVTVGWIDNLIN